MIGFRAELSIQLDCGCIPEAVAPRLYEALTAVTGVTVGERCFGAILFVKPRDVKEAATVLGVKVDDESR